MTWYRGLVVCLDDVLPRVKETLHQSSVFSQIVRRGGETALAFASRDEPDIGSDAVAVGVDARNLHFFVSDYTFRPDTLVPAIGMTAGIALRSGDADREQWGVFRRSLWDKLGPPSQHGSNGGVAGFRWNIEYPYYERADRVLFRKLLAIEKNLVKSDIAYSMRQFDQGWERISGDLYIDEECDQGRGIDLGPSAYVNLAWVDADGTQNFVSANEASFEKETSREVPDSEVWSL